jgi:two-component system CheB/CheR fusion protein
MGDKKKQSALVLAEQTASFPIVGVGASAGGYEAFAEMLSALSVDTGMAFVLIQRLDPAHESMLAPLLARKSILPVNQVTDGMVVVPNHVYVIPPNRQLEICNGLLKLTERAAGGEKAMTIDRFFQSLAAYKRDSAIGVVLSGNETDGTLGLKAIRAEGGICFAQDEESAKYEGMPASAIAAGCVDFILPPRNIAMELARIARERSVRPQLASVAANLPAVNDSDLETLLLLIRNATGTDFSHYKSNTIKRRIARRMLLRKVPGVREYVELLQRDGAELDALCQDFRFNATSFFRDPETFQILEKRIIPKLMGSQPARDGLRVWVAGCSSGEEAYSIAIELVEYMDTRPDKLLVQVFGTDLSESSVEHARAGIYEGSTLARVSPKRLKRFFVKQNRGYQVSQSIRDMCTFRRQDLTDDPAFSHIDLISCRNVLTQLEPILRTKILAAFQNALNENGILLLGKSEAFEVSPRLFCRVEGKGKLYRKSGGIGPSKLRTLAALDRAEQSGRLSKTGMPPLNLQREADRFVWTRYGHAGVIVDESLQILHYRGDTSPYLSITSGAATLSLLKMVRSDLLLDVRTAFEKAKKENLTARKEGVRAHFGGRVREISVEVVPLFSLDVQNRHFLILFNEAQPSLGKLIGPLKTASPAHKKLQQELKATREYIRAIIEREGASTEALRAANEEVLSNNEELQSFNEELETAQEELQCTKEELRNLTEQQSARNIELTQLDDDLRSVLEGLQIPILILGGDRRLRRFTVSAERPFNLLPTDVGRPIHKLRPNLDFPDLQQLISRTIDTLVPQEKEVRDLEGRYYAMRAWPYRTADNRIDGVVIALMDTDSMRTSLNEAERARDYATAMVDTVREPLVAIDSTFRLVTANRSFCDTFRVSPQEVGKRGIFDVADGGWDNPEFRALLDKIRLANTRFEDVKLTCVFPKIGRRTLVLNARGLELAGDQPGLIFLAIEDLTERESTTEFLRQSHERARDLTAALLSAQEEERRRIARELHDDFNQRLAMLVVELENLEKTPFQSPKLIQTCLASVRARTEVISDDMRRMAHELHPSVVDNLGLPSAMRSLCEDFTRQEKLRIDYRQRGMEGTIPSEIALCIYRVTQEALRNVARHSGADRAAVRLIGGNKRILLSVSDAGAGFDVDSASGKKGLGIFSMEERARLVGGTLTIRSKLGEGTNIAIEVPLPKAVVER